MPLYGPKKYVLSLAFTEVSEMRVVWITIRVMYEYGGKSFPKAKSVLKTNCKVEGHQEQLLDDGVSERVFPKWIWQVG